MSTPDQRSLLGEILDWMLAPLLLLWPMSLVLTAVVAQEIANLPYDRELGELAGVLARQVVVAPPTAGALPEVRLTNPAAVNLLRTDDVDQVFYQVLGARGELVAGDRDLPVPTDLPVNRSVRYRDDLMREERVRVAFFWIPLAHDPLAKGVLVQQAETLEKRSRLATEIIKGVALPQFVILPVAVVLAWLALGRGLRPLKRLQKRIRGRDSNDLSPIDELDTPEEVVPLVSAINDLLDRLGQSMATQRHFLADAAHQLKTPLAGLRMQAELAAREIDQGQRDPGALKASLHQISISTQRATRTVNQLLAMARAEAHEQNLQMLPVDLAALTQDVVRDSVPEALDRRIDLGYEGAEPGSTARLLGQPVLLGEMLRNLVDNALHYTPRGGRVTARVTADPFGQVLVVQVEDSGPGIPAAERERVFQPFYRILGTGVDGTGLGLAIVKEIAEKHGAEITISDAMDHPGPDGVGPGTLFTLRFPLNRHPAR